MEYKKTTLSEISNTVFFLFIIFLISFLWCNYYFKNFQKAIICSIVIVFIISIFYIPHKIKKHSKYKSKLISNKKDIYYKNQLLLSHNQTIKDFIINLYNYKVLKTINDYHFVTEDTDIYIFYNENIITNDTLYTYLKESITNKLIIFTFEEPKNKIFIKNKNISYIDYRAFINKCTSVDTYFDNNIILENTPKFRLKDLLCIVLGKNRSKSYFYLGLIILFSSLFTPYNVYYIVISSILFILSVFSKFNTIFN